MEKFNVTPRGLYMERIFRQLDQERLIMIVGVRRSGKSCIAVQLEEELRARSSRGEGILRLNFETMDAVRYTADEMIRCFEKQVVPDTTNYLILDEIARVIGWERAVDHLLRLPNCKVILFSSTRQIVSRELSAVREGKYSLIEALPLSLGEFIQFQGFQETTPADTPLSQKRYHRFEGREYSLEEIYTFYITYGGLPVLKPEYMDRERAWVITDGSYASVVVRDVLENETHSGFSAVADLVLLRAVIMVLARSIGDNISATWVGKQTGEYLRRNSSTKTIESYIRTLLNAHLFYVADRYDLHKKKILKTLGKYYIVDAGLHNYLAGIREEDATRLLENKVFFELLRRGYQVCNGKLDQDEISLIARKGNDKAYIQVANASAPEDMDARLATIRRLRDYHPKMVIALGCESRVLADGVHILNALEFLMGASWR